MKYAFFLGCTIPARSRNYELSARKVADKLGIDLIDVAEFICCGFPMKASDSESAQIMGAYNLCLAQEKGLDICVLCSSCASQLTEVAHSLTEAGPQRDRINAALSRAGLTYWGGVKVRHFARVLLEDIGIAKIKTHCIKDLSDLKTAIHYGCHYLKPSEIYDGFDDVEDPKSLETLVALTGARVIDYPGKKRCCGGPVLPVYENVAMPLKYATKLSKPKIHEKVMARIEQTELTEVADKYPSEISGGMQKRTALARALVTDPSIV